MADQANRTNQCNPDHKPTGPGHQAGYQGAQSNLDNRSGQLNTQSSDQAAQANRTNQCNPCHGETGPGHDAGYHGAPSNLDNRSRQLNPRK